MIVKAVYTVPEIARLMGVETKRAIRLLERAHVPVRSGMPRVVYLCDLKAMAPDLWSSLEEAAHVRRLAHG